MEQPKKKKLSKKIAKNLNILEELQFISEIA